MVADHDKAANFLDSLQISILQKKIKKKNSIFFFFFLTFPEVSEKLSKQMPIKIPVLIQIS